MTEILSVNMVDRAGHLILLMSDRSHENTIINGENISLYYVYVKNQPIDETEYARRCHPDIPPWANNLMWLSDDDSSRFNIVYTFLKRGSWGRGCK